MQSRKLFKNSVAILIGVVLAALITWANTTYTWGKDSQLERCIPEYTYYATERFKPAKTDLKVGEIYTFESPDLSPIYAKGTVLTKYLMAKPGDIVKVSSKGVEINSQLVSKGLYHAYKMNIPEEEFYGERQLKEDEYWFMGSTGSSFDSRYWGAVSYEQIIARSIPIF